MKSFTVQRELWRHPEVGKITSSGRLTEANGLSCILGVYLGALGVPLPVRHRHSTPASMAINDDCPVDDQWDWLVNPPAFPGAFYRTSSPPACQLINLSDSGIKGNPIDQEHSLYQTEAEITRIFAAQRIEIVFTGDRQVAIQTALQFKR